MALKRAYGAASIHTIAVDTFFLMSGLLVAYSQLRKLGQHQGVFNLKQFYLHRYFRFVFFFKKKGMSGIYGRHCLATGNFIVIVTVKR